MATDGIGVRAVVGVADGGRRIRRRVRRVRGVEIGGVRRRVGVGGGPPPGGGGAERNAHLSFSSLHWGRKADARILESKCEIS